MARFFQFLWQRINAVRNRRSQSRARALLSSSKYFDAQWYTEHYPDVVQSGADPVSHFLRFGAREFRSPSPDFDTGWYYSSNPDLASSHLNPLVHFILHGKDEGRSPLPPNMSTEDFPVPLDLASDPMQADVLFMKTGSVASSEEWALFLTHSPWGGLKTHVRSHLEHLRRNGVGTILIVASSQPVVVHNDVRSICDYIVVRRNVGFDFAAWAHVLRLMPQLYAAQAVYLINDSTFVTERHSVFDQVIDRVRASSSAIIGLTESFEHGWHAQSYFLALKQSALSARYVQDFFRQVRSYSRKDSVIQNCEVKFTPGAVRAGLSVDVLFHDLDPENPTLFSWKRLLDSGFPFIKVNLLRGDFENADTSGWRAEVHRRGFDLAIINPLLEVRRTLNAPSLAAGELALAPSVDDEVLDRTHIKIALYGPWNYDNGLGSASRGIISALRRCEFQLNIHAIKKSFHIHRPLAPPLDLCDFEGRADVAIVHLNPDSWNLLTSEQLLEISFARRRIGYWVWEMDRLPTSWLENFTMVDRIWAPSAYCADIFRKSGGAYVDIVPHVVPVNTSNKEDSKSRELFRRFGISDDRRVILFVFDGSSYLVRKNPAALVRAFKQSELSTKGWSLLLKTKYLMERPEEGAALRHLVNATPAAVLVDSPMSGDELETLMEAADIYASPHSSEGFGLTIAEAMAKGKIVVATDFGGSRDYLDAECGFPVAAQQARVTQDFGHYRAGGVWSAVDEQDLTRALVAAARAAETGEGNFGAAAKARVGDLLSITAVSKRIAASVETALSLPSRSFVTERLQDITKVGGFKASEADVHPFLRVVSLDANGFIRPDALSFVARGGADQGWTLFAPEGCHLSFDIAAQVTRWASSRPDVAIFYSDHVALGEETLAKQLVLKPAFNMTLLASSDYIGSALIVRNDVLELLSGVRPDFGSAVMFDLVLRACDAGLPIDRIPEVLVAYPEVEPRPSLEARKKAIASSTTFSQYEVGPRKTSRTLSLTRKFDTPPPVSIIIPTMRVLATTSEPLDADKTCIERLLDQIELTAWPMDKLTVIVGDDISDLPNWSLKRRPFKLERIETPRVPSEHFNYATKMNGLWRAASTEMIVMLNDDVQIVNAGWLTALMTFAVDETVGGVGARLLYEDGTIQHAGIVGGLFGTAAHAWLGEPAHVATYQDWALSQREWSMLTGAVFATRKSLLEEVNGFDERFALEFNDIDLCLRLRALGYRIVYNPDAELVHQEKASRGDKLLSGLDLALFQNRWGQWLADDPAYNGGLRKDVFAIRPSWVHEAWYKQPVA